MEPRIASRWRNRFADQGLAGLEDKPRPGKRPIYGKATDKRILALLKRPPPKGYANWTLRLLARKVVELQIVDAVSHETVRRTLKKTE